MQGAVAGRCRGGRKARKKALAWVCGSVAVGGSLSRYDVNEVHGGRIVVRGAQESEETAAGACPECMRQASWGVYWGGGGDWWLRTAAESSRPASRSRDRRTCGSLHRARSKAQLTVPPPHAAAPADPYCSVAVLDCYGSAGTRTMAPRRWTSVAYAAAAVALLSAAGFADARRTAPLPSPAAKGHRYTD